MLLKTELVLWKVPSHFWLIKSIPDMKTHLARYSTTPVPNFCQRLRSRAGILLRKILYNRRALAEKISITETLKYVCNFKIYLANQHIFHGKYPVFKDHMFLACSLHHFCYSPNRPNTVALWAFALAWPFCMQTLPSDIPRAGTLCFPHLLWT